MFPIELRPCRGRDLNLAAIIAPARAEYVDAVHRAKCVHCRLVHPPFDHVKVVLLHLAVAVYFAIMEDLLGKVKILSYFAVGAWDNLPLLHDKDILARF